jgi:hypothetical protein
MQTINISSGLTLFVKFILPIMGLGVFLPFLLFLFTADSVNYSGSLPIVVVRLLIVLFLVSMGIILRFTLMRLMRVEVDAEHLYVSNYFQTVRYTFDSIETIDDQVILLFRMPVVRLKADGIFGRNIYFWAGSALQEVLEELPTFAAVVPKA